MARSLWSRSCVVGGWRKMNSGITPSPLVNVAPLFRTSSSQREGLKRRTTNALAPASSDPTTCMKSALE